MSTIHTYRNTKAAATFSEEIALRIITEERQTPETILTPAKAEIERRAGLSEKLKTFIANGESFMPFSKEEQDLISYYLLSDQTLPSFFKTTREKILETRPNDSRINRLSPRFYDEYRILSNKKDDLNRMANKKNVMQGKIRLLEPIVVEQKEDLDFF